MTIGINQAPASAGSVPVVSGKSGKPGAKGQDSGSTFGSVVGFSDTKGKDGEMASSSAIGLHKPENAARQKTPAASSEQGQARWLRPGAQFEKVIDVALKGTTEETDASSETLPEDDAAGTDADSATDTRSAKAVGDPLSALMVASRLEARGEQSGNAKSGSEKSGATGTSAATKIPLEGDAASLAEAARAARSAEGKEPSANFRLPGQVSGEMATLSITRADLKNAAKSTAASLTVSLSQATTLGEAAEGADAAIPSVGDDLRQSLEAGGRGRQQADTSGRRSDGKAERVTVVNQQNIPAPVAQSPVSTASALANQLASDTGWREAAAPSFRPLASQPNLSSAHTLKIQLHPAELGVVTASMRFSGEQLTVEIQVENGDAYRRLSADSETIVKSLRAMGLDIDRVTVQQPQVASQTVTRTDSSAMASGFAPRDQQSFGSAGSGGNGETSGGQRSARDGNDGAYGTGDGASTSSNRTGSDLYI
ncbi:flagellar hook-length control protein FliK [Mesorhizobium sp. DCY119]|uniref:flagellar hook-length control protein FliK n=1 Tax=Mesorhizobium sp. DCY119 TaxID=2108445 RepID=UPI000E6C21B8|nr:flagellar hook-length control protein FliK [Mesorhizobium sp. DCY119]RJG44084.1 flagellar hook-length control protein FliK [Mesorhizobium sp. DCY119]